MAQGHWLARWAPAGSGEPGCGKRRCQGLLGLPQLSAVRREPTRSPDRSGNAVPVLTWTRSFFCLSIPRDPDDVRTRGVFVVFFLVCFVFPTTGVPFTDFLFRTSFPTSVPTFTPLGLEKTFRGAAFWSFEPGRLLTSLTWGRDRFPCATV